MKVIIGPENGFELKDEYCEKLGFTRVDAPTKKYPNHYYWEPSKWNPGEEYRIDSRLIKMIEEDPRARMKIIEIPDGSYYYITNWDGEEHLVYSRSPINAKED